jgi:hypothetical protein
LDALQKVTGKRKAAGSGVKREKGASSKRIKKSGEGMSTSRDTVKRESSANCTLNRNCALLDNPPPLSFLAEPCGVCVFLVFSCIFLFFLVFYCILLYFYFCVLCVCVDVSVYSGNPDCARSERRIAYMIEEEQKKKNLPEEKDKKEKEK